jgi:hypothetical protein
MQSAFRSPMEDRIVAIHEAGHVVVANALGFTPASASIDPRDGGSIHQLGSMGFDVNLASAARMQQMTAPERFEERDRAWRGCVVLAAGEAAVRVAMSRGAFQAGTQPGSGDDKRLAGWLFRSFELKGHGATPSWAAGPNVSGPAIWEGLVNEAEKMVDQEWYAVEAIADALLAKRVLDGEELRVVLGSAR